MNSTMIKTAKAVKNELISFAQKFYGTKLKPSTIAQLLALPIEDQLWLLEQYKAEVNSFTQPDLNSLY
jgi:hypothetical protein